jgi:hypothetical protein
MQLRPITLPLWCVYRDGLLVAGFTDIETAAAYEEALDTEAEALELASGEPTPIGEAAADAVTVALFTTGLLDDAWHYGDGSPVPTFDQAAACGHTPLLYGRCCVCGVHL